MRRWGTALAALMLVGVGVTATTASATAATTTPAAACAVTWGSLEKTDWDSDYKPLVNIRAGQHECYDRLVFDIRGTVANPIGYIVRYVDEFVGEGSGEVIPVEGGAILGITVLGPSYDPETGTPTLPTPLTVNVDGYRTFRDVEYGGSFEGYTAVGLGVRARLPFRVFQTANHLVVDVAHTW